jgi:starch synthase
MPRILFATSEAFPLIKTGGLGDVSSGLPAALSAMAQDVRIVLPAYGDILASELPLKKRAGLSIDGKAVTVLEGAMPDSGVPVWLVDHPGYFDRAGNPYLDADGRPWQDNAERFALFCQAVVRIALDSAGLDWQPDIIHCNDWQSGLVPALLSLHAGRPGTVFTIHNLAYQGNFPYSSFEALGLPEKFWSPDALEFHEQVSFIKGGLVFADQITTVSPGYADEIQTEAYGCGLHGLLRHHRDRLSGILNGIDTTQWDPASDPHLSTQYDIDTLVPGKQANKQALLSSRGLPAEPDVPLIGMVGRLVEQKGIDLLLEILDECLELPLQMVILGSGDVRFERKLVDAASRYTDRLSVMLGYDETLAHRIEAGADIFLMPSRFEPCGLNQLYSLRYGTLPLVRRVGGLADTVVDATTENIRLGRANGIVFDTADSASLLQAIRRAIALYHDAKLLNQLRLAGMQQDVSWQRSAQDYLDLYDKILMRAAAGDRG